MFFILVDSNLNRSPSLCVTITPADTEEVTPSIRRTRDQAVLHNVIKLWSRQSSLESRV